MVNAIDDIELVDPQRGLVGARVGSKASGQDHFALEIQVLVCCLRKFAKVQAVVLDVRHGVLDEPAEGVSLLGANDDVANVMSNVGHTVCVEQVDVAAHKVLERNVLKERLVGALHDNGGVIRTHVLGKLAVGAVVNLLHDFSDFFIGVNYGIFEVDPPHQIGFPELVVREENSLFRLQSDGAWTKSSMYTLCCLMYITPLTWDTEYRLRWWATMGKGML